MHIRVSYDRIFALSWPKRTVAAAFLLLSGWASGSELCSTLHARAMDLIVERRAAEAEGAIAEFTVNCGARNRGAAGEVAELREALDTFTRPVRAAATDRFNHRAEEDLLREQSERHQREHNARMGAVWQQIGATVSQAVTDRQAAKRNQAIAAQQRALAIEEQRRQAAAEIQQRQQENNARWEESQQLARAQRHAEQLENERQAASQAQKKKDEQDQHERKMRHFAEMENKMNASRRQADADARNKAANDAYQARVREEQRIAQAKADRERERREAAERERRENERRAAESAARASRTHTQYSDSSVFFDYSRTRMSNSQVDVVATRNPADPTCVALDIRNKTSSSVQVQVWAEAREVTSTGIKMETPIGDLFNLGPGQRRLIGPRVGTGCSRDSFVVIQRVESQTR